jgi:hemerythrin-like domain-containing protein
MQETTVNGIDLSIMIGSHVAFRRDLTKLARAAERREAGQPDRALAIANGWATFKHQLLSHHHVEDASIWPLLRERLAASPDALSVLDEMEYEHGFIDPLLAAVDKAFGDDGTAPALADVIGELTSKLTGHLDHEEKDALQLIGRALTPPEWGQAVAAINQQPGAAEVSVEMFPWILEGATEEEITKFFANMPFLAPRYREEWKPAYQSVTRW